MVYMTRDAHIFYLEGLEGVAQQDGLCILFGGRVSLVSIDSKLLAPSTVKKHLGDHGCPRPKLVSCLIVSATHAREGCVLPWYASVLHVESSASDCDELLVG